MDHLLVFAAAVGIIAVQVITAWKMNGKLSGVEAIPAQLQIIHEQTNSQLSALKNELAAATAALTAANLRIQHLEDQATSQIRIDQT